SQEQFWQCGRARNRSRARPSRLSSRAILVKLRWPCLHLQRVASWANLKLTIRSSRRRFAARLNSGVRGHMMFRLLLVVLVATCPVTVFAQNCASVPLQQELLKRNEVDQAARKTLAAKPESKEALDRALQI